MPISLQASISDALIGPVLTATVRTGEASILSVQCDRADGALHDVRVDVDTAVVEEASEAVPTRARIADRFGELGLLADQAKLGAQPGFEIFDDWPTSDLADGTPLLGAAAGNVLLDSMRSLASLAATQAGRGELVEAAAHSEARFLTSCGTERPWIILMGSSGSFVDRL